MWLPRLKALKKRKGVFRIWSPFFLISVLAEVGGEAAADLLQEKRYCRSTSCGGHQQEFEELLAE